MNNCEKCIHSEVCLLKADFEKSPTSICQHFKNKYNFVELPYEIGDTLYDISEFIERVPNPEIYESKMTYITIVKDDNNNLAFDIDGNEFPFEDFGKVLFKTKTQAEQALHRYFNSILY
jgi:hypothetical protein